MKNTTNLLQWLSLFLLLNISIFATNAASFLPLVRDLDKKPLRAGLRYYILPLIRGQGGGVTLATSSENKTCPHDQIVQDPFEVNRGLPLTFSPVNSRIFGVVRESTDLNIKFSAARTCGHSNVWRLGEYDETKNMYFLTTGGVGGIPRPQYISSWFKIQKFGDDYKLVYCPTICKFCKVKVICKDVGIYVENGKRRLSLTDDQPFAVVFKKA